VKDLCDPGLRTLQIAATCSGTAEQMTGCSACEMPPRKQFTQFSCLSCKVRIQRSDHCGTISIAQICGFSTLGLKVTLILPSVTWAGTVST